MPTPPKNKKKKPDHGVRTKAGQLLSQFVKRIALEETEFIKDPDGGKDRMVTKAEALVRLIWRRALGYEEVKVDDKGGSTTVQHLPDRVYVGMLFDRMEGRAPLMNPDKKGGRTIADRVSEQGTKRLNKMAEDNK